MEILNKVLPATFIELPIDPLLFQSQRTRFAFGRNNTVIPIMHRKVTEDMLKFVLNRGQQPKFQVDIPRPIIPAVYIHGPRGVGKSYSLFEVVWLLRADPHNRVIYIPDCGGWSGTFIERTLELMVEAVCVAFCEDKEVLEYCDAVQLEESQLGRFLEWLPQFCMQKGLHLYAIFDQHNGLEVEFLKKKLHL